MTQSPGPSDRKTWIAVCDTTTQKKSNPEETPTMRLQFVEKYVQSVPDQPGIFTLWDHSHPVYIGRTAPRSNLRAELDHALTMAMAEDLSVTHFSLQAHISMCAAV